jgi:hypothetical protein
LKTESTGTKDMIFYNLFFFIIVLNSITGTIAFFLCKWLINVAEKKGAIRVIYPMCKLVLVFLSYQSVMCLIVCVFGDIWLCILER